MNLVTEWASYKKRLESLEATKGYTLALEEILRARQWLKNIPMTSLVVGDLQLIFLYLAESEIHEKRVKAFTTYYRAFPKG